MNDSTKKLSLIYEAQINPKETGLVRKLYARIETLVQGLAAAQDFETFRKISTNLHDAERSYVSGSISPTGRSTEDEVQYQIEKLTGEKLHDFNNGFRIPNDLDLLKKTATNEARSLYAAYQFARYVGQQLYVDLHYGQEVAYNFAKKVFDMHRSLVSARELMKKGSEEAGVNLDI